MRHALGLTFGVLAAAGGSATAQGLAEIWRLDGLERPESAYYDAANDRIIVGNMGTSGSEGGTDGRLSTVSPDGQMMEADWATGLTDPRGMASHDGSLYVADNAGVHVVDLASGEVEQTVSLPEAQFPNDVTATASGDVYVTDFGAGTVYKLSDGSAEIWMRDLPRPNGILADGERLIIGSFGEGAGEGSSAEQAGGLLFVSLSDQSVTEPENAQGVGNIDGVVKSGERIIYDANPTGKIFGWQNGDNQLLAQLRSGTADLGLMENTLLVPIIGSGELVALELEPD